MNKRLWIAAALLWPAVAMAAGGGYPLMEADVDLTDRASLQRGAGHFVNYCMGCHSMQYLRYKRLARDLGIPERLVEENLIFTTDEEGTPTKIGQRMEIAMDDYYAEEAFGIVPPDLTLTARSRGPDWIYTYLHTFYVDEQAQWGVNNAVFPDVSMPHVLWRLQGLQAPEYEEHTDEDGNTERAISGFTQVRSGQLSAEEYDRLVRDLTAFMTYAAEPAKLTRYKVGAWVLVFLALFSALAYLLKKEYWRDIK
jgi:ubiquinol-cytochrome c reductase cytochrome c1 subunit